MENHYWKGTWIMCSLTTFLLIGGGIGTVLGRLNQCSSGACGLTSKWWRGAIYGAIAGALFYFLAGGSEAAPLDESSGKIPSIGESQFDAEVIQSASPVVADFYATWCGPCKILSPRLDQLAGTFAGRIKFVKVNVDEAPALARRFDIQGIPTLLFFKNGKVVDRIVGLPAADALKTRLESLTGTNAAAKN
jgi:thioredoxin